MNFMAPPGRILPCHPSFQTVWDSDPLSTETKAAFSTVSLVHGSNLSSGGSLWSVEQLATFKFFPDLYPVGCHLPPQPCSPAKDGRTLDQLEDKRKSQGNNTCLSKNCKGNWRENFSSCVKPTWCRKLENFKTYGELPSGASIRLSLLSAQHVLGERLCRRHLLVSAHIVLSKRRTRGITGAQTI